MSLNIYKTIKSVTDRRVIIASCHPSRHSAIIIGIVQLLLFKSLKTIYLDYLKLYYIINIIN